MLRIASRGSALARWQAEHVAALLAAADPHAERAAELVIVETTADQRLDIPIEAMGGKGVFVKEVQAAVLDGRADIAVHSAKDLPSVTFDGLVLAAVPERGDPRDALVGSKLLALREGAEVATGSLRRRVQLAELRPDLVFSGLRGNMQTRLDKAAGFDAIVVASVALERLGLAGRIDDVLSVEQLLPQVGQGALAVECRASDASTIATLAQIEDAVSRRRVDAERAFLAELGGDCDLPAAAYAVDTGATLTVDGMLAVDGQVRRARVAGTDGPAIGAALARQLRDEAKGTWTDP
ncbi:MAG: hydroxymethylbilane synthase [Acidimicrobiales bacterium]